MDEFEQNIQRFSSTIYGIEMRESMGWCFRSIYERTEEINKRLGELKSIVDRLEGGAQNAVF